MKQINKKSIKHAGHNNPPVTPQHFLGRMGLAVVVEKKNQSGKILKQKKTLSAHQRKQRTGLDAHAFLVTGKSGPGSYYNFPTIIIAQAITERPTEKRKQPAWAGPASGCTEHLLHIESDKKGRFIFRSITGGRNGNNG